MLLYILDLCGVAIFAITGCLRVRDKRIDLLGVLIIAAVTAVGGGTTRDVFLGIQPVFWIRDTAYLGVALGAALFTFVAARFIAFPERLLLVLDAGGLAVASILGVEVALAHGAPLPIAVMMGMLSGTTGGVVRDVLANEVPFIFSSELYATAALAGALVFVVLSQAALFAGWAAVLGMLTVLALRLAAIRYRLTLPAFKAHPPR